MNKRHKIYMVILVIAGIIAMAILNFDQSNYISNLLARVIRKVAIIIGDSHYSVSQINLVIRKFGHFIEYMFLMVVCYSIIHSYMKNEFYIFVLSFLAVACIAIIDEGIIQNFIASGRNGQSYDVMIDFAGSVIGYLNIKVFQFLNYHEDKPHEM